MLNLPAKNSCLSSTKEAQAKRFHQADKRNYSFPMHLMFLLLLAFPFASEAYYPDSLNIISSQADYVALVEMDSRPMDSIASLMEDLGTVYYFPRFRVIRVFREHAPLPDSSCTLVISNVNPQFQTLYQPGGRYYLFLSLGLPKHPDLSASLMPYGKSGGMPVLLPGGLIHQSAVPAREIRKLTRPSAMARAAMNDNCKKMLRIAKRAHHAMRCTGELRRKKTKGSVSPSVYHWLQEQQDIAGVMTDTCTAHIAIWPGWSDYLFWVNTPEGMKEYMLTIQHGTTYGCCCFRWTSERSRVKNLCVAPGGRDEIFRLCELTARYERQDRYNNLVRLTLDEGRLTWSVPDAPLHLDSEGKLIRLKVTLTNHGDSALHVRWPGRQNHDRKIIRFALHHTESRKVFRENPLISLAHDETLGPSEVLLAAGASVSAWHSLNDTIFSGTDATTLHHFDSLPPGTYSVEAIYRPHPVKQETYSAWEPFVDSITAWTGYPFYLRETRKANPVTVICRVVETSQTVLNDYQQQTHIHGIVEVLQNPAAEVPRPGSLIAWKMLLSNPLPGHTFGRPPYYHEIAKPGDLVEISLIPPAYPGMVTAASGKYPLFVTDRDVRFK